MFTDDFEWGEQYLNHFHWGAMTGTSAVKLDHLVCCRDVEWRRALCGHIEKEPALLHDSDIACTGCIEAAEGMGVISGDRQCPVDNHPCPDEAEMQRMMDERISGT